MISFVIPVFNERDTLCSLSEQIATQCAKLNLRKEIVFVNDGSTDGSGELIDEICNKNTDIKVIHFAGNQGKAAALQEGFAMAAGDGIITMDADLQDDPVEIGKFVEKLDEGFDLVSGWKHNRRDPWHKTVPSRVFNYVVSKVFDIALHDFNCGYKAYRTELVKRLQLYGELHRYIPVFAKQQGARIAEVSVRHNPRLCGKSKYGVERLMRGCLDLFTVVVITRYLKRPLHLFGAWGLAFFMSGFLVLAYLAAIWLMGMRPIGNRPLLFYGMLMVIAGLQLFSLGVVAELIIRLVGKQERPIIRDSQSQ